MAYHFYLGKTMFPLPPGKLSTKIKNNNQTLELINQGEINILKTAGLTEISFETELPQVRYPFAEYPDGFHPAKYYLDLLEKLKTSRKPFQFLVTRTEPGDKLIFDTNMSVSLEEYTITENADEGGGVTVSVKLKQYRPYHTQTMTVIKAEEKAVAQEAPPQRPAAKETPKTYTVKKGDCLWTICKKELGDGSKCYDIAKLNGIKNPNLIYPGQVIRFG